MVEPITYAAGFKIFEVVINDIYNSLKEVSAKKFNYLNVKNKISSIYSNLYKVRQVKTLWQIDKSVDLLEFYCDSNVRIGNQRKKIEKLSDFSCKNNILIEGIAGQGKSIFLKYLCYQELTEGKRFPILIELRKIKSGQSLTEYIIYHLETLGFKGIDKDILHGFFDTGKFVLFLDAFDETIFQNQENIIAELELLSQGYENLQVIVTSRPRSGLEMSVYFRRVILDNLIDDEYSIVIRKLLLDEVSSKQLINTINSHSGRIKELLITPLLVTLLIITYKSYQKLPDQLSDFYEDLFQLLLQRHDGTKPGYNRNRSCKMNDTEYRKVFETLCFLSKGYKEDTPIFNFEKIYSVIENSLKEHTIDEDPECYLKDICKITCLLLKDGNDYRFIHKSVQEYYTAYKIKRKPGVWVKKFYTHILEKKDHRRWYQELRFLSEIDYYRYNKYFNIPTICEILNINEADLVNNHRPKVTIDFIKEIYNGILVNLGLFRNNNQKGELYLSSITFSGSDSLYFHKYFNILIHLNYSKIKKNKYKNKNNNYTVNISDLIENGCLNFGDIELVSNELFDKGVQILKNLKSDEDDDLLKDLIEKRY